MNSPNFQAIYVMWLRQLKLFIRARSRLIANIIQPFFFLAFLGLGLRSISLPGLSSRFGYLDFLAPGMIAMSVIFSSMFAGISVIWDRQFGFLKEIMVAPVSRVSIVLGRALGGMTTAFFQGALFLAEFMEKTRWAHIDIAGLRPHARTSMIPSSAPWARRHISIAMLPSTRMIFRPPNSKIPWGSWFTP